MKTASDLFKEYYEKSIVERVNTTIQDYVFNYQQQQIDEQTKMIVEQARTASNQQAKIDDLTKRIEKTDSLIIQFGDDISAPLRNALIDAIRGLKDL